jgi:hypothetical protein
MGPKTLPTIWGTYMKLVTKYQISAINSYWEKCDEKYLGRTDRGKTIYPPPPSGSGGIKMNPDMIPYGLSSYVNQLILESHVILYGLKSWGYL